jgi:hypothetical protein
MQPVEFDTVVSEGEATACLSRSLGQCVAPAVNKNSEIPRNGITTGFHQSSGFYVALCKSGLEVLTIVIFTITVLRKVTPCCLLDDLLNTELLPFIFRKTAVLTSLFTSLHIL